MKSIIIILLVIIAASPVYAKKRLHKEKHYQDIWCSQEKGKTEVKMPDKSRADCITSTQAVEVEFANKWKNSIGQSLNYAMQTGLEPTIVLILEKDKEYKYWVMLNTVIETYRLPIKAILFRLPEHMNQ